MTFDEHVYLLPHDLIPTDLSTLKAVFVEQMSESTTRQQIFEAFTTYFTDLQASLNTRLEVWVNGSFTTQKLNPADIDFVIFVDRQVAARHQMLIRLFRQRRYAKDSVTDEYFVEAVSETQPDYEIYQFNRADKHRDFAFDRLGNPKGYLQVRL